MYDFIIAGGGSAGCVLAARLSEDPHINVLLLEAGGPDHRSEIQVPAAFPRLFRTEVDWNHSTMPESECLSRRMYWPRGKVIGGSGSINAMLYVRGNPWDYNHWHSLGNDGWSWQDVKPWFLKSERNNTWKNEHHGTTGPLEVCDQRCPSILSHAFVDAAESLGFPRNPDFNGESQDGFGFYQVTQKGGRRWSAARAFLHAARSRRNLQVVTHAHVLRVVIENERAVAVEYAHDRQLLRAECSREIVLASGTVGTPNILLHSGIGPWQDLHAYSVRLRHALPGVGYNLQDHLVAGVITTCRKPIALPVNPPGHWMLEWMALGRSPLTSPIAEAGGFLKLHPQAEVPDVQFHFAPAEFRNHGFDTEGLPMYTIGATVLRPKSRGRIALRSNRPEDMPFIEVNYLTCACDMELFVDAVMLARNIAKAEPFTEHRADEFLPGKGVDSREDIRHVIRRECQTIYHPVGTCKMGNDRMAVVDNKLRVRGLEGLRVADASIMPTLPGGNTNAPTIMIAERAAHWMLHGD